MVSDAVASYFVFDLGGFEFLLDTIGVGSPETEFNLRRRKLSGEVQMMEGGGTYIEEESKEEKMTSMINHGSAESNANTSAL